MNEQAKVGLVVLVAAGLLLTALFAIANMHLGGNYSNFKTYFKFAGGLEPGAAVRFAGLKVGRVSAVRVDPKDITRIEVMLEVSADTPLKTDSQAAISQLGLLGENYVEILPGKSGVAMTPGSTVPSAEVQDLNALIRKMSGLAVTAQPLIADLRTNLNKVSSKADQVLTQLTDVTAEENRKHIHSILHESDTMMVHNREKIDTIATNFEKASGDLKPLMTDLRNTNAKLEKLLDNANGMVGENREQIRASIADLQKTLVSTRAMVDQLQSTLVYNSDNLDIMLENFRQISENFREFSDTVKQRPFSLIRVKPLPDRQPAGAAGKTRSRQGGNGR